MTSEQYDASDFAIPPVTLDNIVGFRIYDAGGRTIYREGWAPDVIAINVGDDTVEGFDAD